MGTTVITDGSADNRTRHGGWCAIIRTPSTLVELTGFAEDTTSNRMELTAAIEGLKAVTIPSEITLITDSTYLLKTLKNKWYVRWLEAERLGAAPRPNMDLWHQLIGLTQYHEVHFIKIKGHSGDYWNERADRLAGFARRDKEASRTEVSPFSEERCGSVAPSGRRCKLHDCHTGRHYWTEGKANGIEVYGTDGTDQRVGEVRS